MIKLIIKAEEIRTPEGTKNFVMDVWTEPHQQEPHCTVMEMQAMTFIKNLVSEAVTKVGETAVEKGLAGLFVERTQENYKRTDD